MGSCGDCLRAIPDGMHVPRTLKLARKSQSDISCF
jgi:hypothetical protein